MSDDRFPIEAGHILMFARSLGDDDPVFDPGRAAETEPGCVLAPPTFPVAYAQFDPEYPLRPRPGQPWPGSGATDTGQRGESGQERQLHAEQEFTYERPLRAGEVLRVRSRRGQSWDKQGSRGGSLRFTETITEYLDEAGDVVATARAVGVVTGHVPTSAEG